MPCLQQSYSNILLQSDDTFPGPVSVCKQSSGKGNACLMLREEMLSEYRISVVTLGYNTCSCYPTIILNSLAHRLRWKDVFSSL